MLQYFVRTLPYLGFFLSDRSNNKTLFRLINLSVCHGEVSESTLRFPKLWHSLFCEINPDDALRQLSSLLPFLSIGPVKEM